MRATKFDTVPSREYGTPDLAVDPENPLDVVATMPNLPTKVCGLMRSRDGGVTWSRLDESPSLSSYPFCLQTGNTNVAQGLLAFGRNHTLYYLLDGWDTKDGDNNGSVFVGRSTDFGVTWSTTTVKDNRVATDPKVNDRPISGLAVDTHSGSQDVVAVSWREDPQGLSSPNNAPSLPLVSISTDGAMTFSPPVNLAAVAYAQEPARASAIASATTTTSPTTSTTAVAPATTTTAAPTTAAPPTTTTTAPAGSRAAQPDQVANFGGANPSVAVDNKGTFYAAWVEQTANISPTPPFAHFLAKSTDKGKTWTTTQISPYTANNVNGFNALHLVWSPTGGPDGTLHFVYEGSDRPQISNLTQVFYRRSTDGGQTWSDAKILNDDDPTKLTYSGDPNISVAPDGRVDVAFWDTRNDPGVYANDVYYTSSSDNGVTWSKNIRVTDRLVDRTIGVYANNYDVTGPPGIRSTNDYAIFGWDDSRNGNALLNTQDIYVALVQYQTITTGGSTTVKYLLAAAVGLLVVGLGLVITAFARRRRMGAL